jgi:hypothetical protein
MITYKMSIKRGNRYVYKTKTFNSTKHFLRYVDVINASGDKVIDTFLV